MIWRETDNPRLQLAHAYLKDWKKNPGANMTNEPVKVNELSRLRRCKVFSGWGFNTPWYKERMHVAKKKASIGTWYTTSTSTSTSGYSGNFNT